MRVPGRLVIHATWLLTAAAGGWALAKYESTPGGTGETPQRWPAGSHIEFHGDRPVLLMFAHPHCPCTRASIDELNRLLAQCDGKVETQVLFIRPHGMPDDWTQTASWKK